MNKLKVDIYSVAALRMKPRTPIGTAIQEQGHWTIEPPELSQLFTKLLEARYEFRMWKPEAAGIDMVILKGFSDENLTLLFSNMDFVLLHDDMLVCFVPVDTD